MIVESDVFDKVIELTLDGQSELASPNDLTDDITDDNDEAISIMLTGDDDDGEYEYSSQNVTLLSDVYISDTLPVSSVLSEASTAKCLFERYVAIQRKSIKRQKKMILC